MKTPLFLLLVLVCALPLRADNWLENGDFSDGTNHWYGNGQTPADFTPTSPLDKPDSLTSKGLIIPLKDLDWRKVAQDFKGRIANGVLTVSYMVSPDLAFSNKPDDYSNIPHHIDYDHWKPFNIPLGSWIIFISDFGTDHGTYYMINPKLGSSDPQEFQAKISNLTPLEDKTITLAFPPGSGTVVILKVSLTDQ